MKILFLHPNFPAQFKSPCTELANKRHDIKFICQTHYGRSLVGVEKLVLKGEGSHEKTLSSSKSEQDRIYFRANAYRQSFIVLRKKGWNPDVTIAHSGWGCGIHLKEIWPRTFFISYLEWWFDMESELIQNLKNNQYFELTEESCRGLWNRNIPNSLELCTSNKIVTPTEWQKRQLPNLLKKNCLVVNDKINQDLFFPEPKKISRTPLITYGTRGMEPMRGFPQFIQLLPNLLRKWPQLMIEIAGTDTVSYGGKNPKEKSWKNWALKLLSIESLEHRVKWKGTMPLETYADWLKKTWCHIYISEPFVTSWSYIEAMHCCLPMVSSDTESCREFQHLNPFCSYVDHNNQDSFIHAVNDKIRIMSKTNFESWLPRGLRQAELSEACKSHETSLATLIADVEATTKI